MTARFGGEEFVIVLPGSNLAGAGALGEKVRQGVENLRVVHSASSVGPYLTASVGGASIVSGAAIPISP